MSSVSSNIFQNDINSVIILIFIINMLPNMMETYMSPQFIRATKDNDMIRNFCIFLGILILVELSDIEANTVFVSMMLYSMMLLFSKQTLWFSLIQILLLVFIFSKYNRNENLSHISYYILFFYLVSVYGCYRYYQKQLRDKGERFSIEKFIFGKREQQYNHEYVQFQGL